MNNEIRKLENLLVGLLNDSPVPIEAKRILLEILVMKVKEASDKEIMKELHIEETQDAENVQSD